jgi:hypothetical protein
MNGPKDDALYALGPWAERPVDSTPESRAELVLNVTTQFERAQERLGTAVVAEMDMRMLRVFREIVQKRIDELMPPRPRALGELRAIREADTRG